MMRRCLCPCHVGGHGDRQRADGVDVTDAIEAAVACDGCRKHHTPALLDPDRAPRTPVVTESGEFAPPSRWTPEMDVTDGGTVDGEDGG